MKCPLCGTPIQSGKSKCLRCGYEFKSLIISHTSSHEDEQQTNSEDETEYKEIDPRQTFMGTAQSGGGSIFGSSIFGSSGGSIFGSGGGIFGGLNGIIGDLFGDFFDVADEDDEDYEGYEAHDYEGQKIVEVSDIEEYDADGNLKNKKKEGKGFFRRKKKDGDKN